MGKNEKTNVMRVLDAHKISYVSYNYVDSGVISGIDVARVIDQDPKRVFKTLVTRSGSGKLYVFVVPVELELNLKKAAKSVGDKSVEMIKSKELLGLTGYIHGGCSPIGMKKIYPTVFHKSAAELDKIIFSAGKIGYQVELCPKELSKVIKFSFDDIAE